jgi:hypothetical protein
MPCLLQRAAFVNSTKPCRTSGSKKGEDFNGITPHRDWLDRNGPIGNRHDRRRACGIAEVRKLLAAASF